MEHAKAVDAMPAEGSLKLTRLSRLTAANTPEQVAAAIIARAQARSGGTAVSVPWGLHVPDHLRSTSQAGIDRAHVSWLSVAAESARRSGIRAGSAWRFALASNPSRRC